MILIVDSLNPKRGWLYLGFIIIPVDIEYEKEIQNRH